MVCQELWNDLSPTGNWRNRRLDANGDARTPYDQELFDDSYAQQSGLSGVGRVSSASVGNRKGYAGYEWDETISVYHVRHRVYLPEIGRWSRRDPLGYVDGMSVYQYAQSRAIGSVDPDGRISIGCNAVRGGCSGGGWPGWPNGFPPPPPLVPSTDPQGECAGIANNACADHPVYGDMVRHLERRYREVCKKRGPKTTGQAINVATLRSTGSTPVPSSLPDVKCDPDCPAGNGWTSPGGPIVICTGGTGGEMHMFGVYIHELNHQIQFCMIENDGGNPNDIVGYSACLVAETQAYLLDGSCSRHSNGTTTDLLNCLCNRACGSCWRQAPLEPTASPTAASSGFVPDPQLPQEPAWWSTDYATRCVHSDR